MRGTSWEARGGREGQRGTYILGKATRPLGQDGASQEAPFDLHTPIGSKPLPSLALPGSQTGFPAALLSVGFSKQRTHVPPSWPRGMDIGKPPLPISCQSLSFPFLCCPLESLEKNRITAYGAQLLAQGLAQGSGIQVIR